MVLETIIPIVSIITPIGVLFTVRMLDKGEKKKSTLQQDVEEIQKFAESNRGVIQALVKDVEKLEERIRVVEIDLNRILGKLNSRKYD